MSRMSALLAAAALLAPGCDTSTCQTVSADIGEVCNQGVLAADRQLVLEVREMCGPGCSSQPSCDAFLRNGQVVLDVSQTVCTEASFYQCIALGCLGRVIRCTLPNLQEGDYALVAPGTAVQLLRVRADGQTSCRFPVLGDGGV